MKIWTCMIGDSATTGSEIHFSAVVESQSIVLAVPNLSLDCLVTLRPFSNTGCSCLLIDYVFGAVPTDKIDDSKMCNMMAMGILCWRDSNRRDHALEKVGTHSEGINVRSVTDVQELSQES